MRKSTNNLLAVELQSAERASQNCGHSNDKFQTKSFFGRIAALAICLFIQAYALPERAFASANAYEDVRIGNIALGIGEFCLAPDGFPYEELFATIGITPNSIRNMNLEMTAKEIMPIIKKEDLWYSFDLDVEEQSTHHHYYVRYADCFLTISMDFKRCVVSYNSKTKEYEFSDDKPTMIMIDIKCEGRLEGKCGELFDAAKKLVETLGKYEKVYEGSVEDEIEKMAAYKLPNGNYCFVFKEYSSTIDIALAGKEVSEDILKAIE